MPIVYLKSAALSGSAANRSAAQHVPKIRGLSDEVLARLRTHSLTDLYRRIKHGDQLIHLLTMDNVINETAAGKQRLVSNLKIQQDQIRKLIKEKEAAGEAEILRP